MQCRKCQYPNEADAQFCEECGVKLAHVCHGCGRELKPTARFCPGCGEAAKGTSSEVPPSESTRPVLRHETPKHLADKILQSKSALEGERKQVTVLFADVKGSMELAEQLDPEEWSAIMQRFFKMLSDGVERFEGYVDKFTGDGVMALFGAPIAHEDHAHRACYAALHLAEGLRSYANELRLRRGLNFSARIGINSGEVIVGKIGDDLRMEYTAQGHTVGLAARMEQIAEAGKAYLTAHTAARVQGYFALADLGEMEIKGVQGALRVHELQGLGQMRTRLDVSRSRGFSRFVGRGDEMHVLESALARANEGQAQIIGIVGEAGLGKSRLCFEFLERCRARGLVTNETTGVAHGKAIPFMPILRLFRVFFGISEQDSDATARERIAGRLLLLDDRLRETMPLMFDFMGVPDPEQPAPRMDPEARQRQLFDVVRRVVQARSQKETSVTLLEDLHWFDGGSEAFLEPLFDAARGSRWLIVVNFRPEYHAAWMSKSYYHQLPLAPLGADAIRELLDALLGSHSSIAGLAGVIHARTAGNPFFTEEVVQNLIESGKLQGSKGAYRLVAPVEKLEVPSSVHALLAARIDRLAEREKDVLQTAAVIGREFDEPTLAAVVEEDAPQLREALQTLKDAEFVYEQSLYPIAEYLFKHPLTQEVALASQLQERRKRLHAAVARVIEAAHPGDLDQRAALLAHHWEQAADLRQAVRWHRRAAESAEVSDPMEGLRHWRKVRELGATLSDDDIREARLRACRAIVASGSWRLGMSEAELSAVVDEGRTLARALNRPAAVASLLGGIASHRAMLGQAQAALEIAEESFALIDDTFERGDIFTIEVTRAYHLFLSGRIPQSIDAFDRIVVRTEEDPLAGRESLSFSPLIWAEHCAGFALAQAGRFEECWPRLARALRLAREHALRENLAWVVGTLSYCAYYARGSSGSPIRDLSRAASEAVEIAAAIGSRYSQIAAAYHFATASLLSGEYATCEETLTESLVLARTSGTGLDFHGHALVVLADARLARGNSDGAIAAAREGITVSDAGGAWFQAALARTALVDALVGARGAELEVKSLLTEARELVRKSGGNSLLPRLREAEARLTGCHDPTALEAGLRDAEAMYRAMGAPDPADRLVLELAALRA